MGGLSVILTVYKNSETLDRAITSVADCLSQAIACDKPSPELELIAVLDGPDEHAAEIIAGYTVPFQFHTFQLSARSGIAEARNHGAQKSSMRWLTFLDGDDELTFERLKHVSAAAPGTVQIGKQSIVWDRQPSAQPFDKSAFQDVGEYHLSSMLIDRDLFQQLGGFDSDFVLGDDWDLVVRMRERGVPIEFVESTFVKRHFTGRNASLNQPQIKQDYFKSIRSHLGRRA